MTDIEEDLKRAYKAMLKAPYQPDYTYFSNVSDLEAAKRFFLPDERCEKCRNDNPCTTCNGKDCGNCEDCRFGEEE